MVYSSKDIAISLEFAGDLMIDVRSMHSFTYKYTIKMQMLNTSRVER
jgi:hypothetical protein